MVGAVSSLESKREFPDVELSHMYADNCAMQLLREPKQAADLLNRSVRRALALGLRTADIAAGEKSVSGSTMTDEILLGLREISSGGQKKAAL